MARDIEEGSVTKGFEQVVGASDGGIGTETAEAALAALGGYAKASVGERGGPIPLVDGVIPPEYLDTDSMSPTLVSGKTRVDAGATEDYYITGFDSFVNYHVEPLRGSVKVNGAMIRYTAPNVAGSAGFTINGRVVRIAITPAAGDAPQVYRPVIEAPVKDGTISWKSYTFVSSLFTAAGDQSHVSSDWQIATDAAFTTIVAQSMGDTEHLTSWPVMTLEPNTTYYARVRHTGSLTGDSPWSDASGFKTGARFSAVETQVLSGGNSFGFQCAFSRDGNTLAVTSAPGNYGTSTEHAVRIYERVDGLYVEKFSYVGPWYFGFGLTMDEAGETVVVGSGSAWDQDEGSRTAYIFSKTAGVWSLETTLTESAVCYSYSLSISSDGKRLVVGAWASNLFYIYEKGSAGWVRVTYFTGSGFYSWGLAISPDGNRAVSISQQSMYLEFFNRSESGAWTRAQSFSVNCLPTAVFSTDNKSLYIKDYSGNLRRYALNASNAWEYIGIILPYSASRPSKDFSVSRDELIFLDHLDIFESSAKHAALEYKRSLAPSAPTTIHRSFISATGQEVALAQYGATKVSIFS